MSSAGKPTLLLDWCSRAAATYAVTHWHYSKTMPVSKMIHIGVWENSVFIGCIIYSWGGNHRIGAPYGLSQLEVCELVRVALNKHFHPVSKILAISLKFLKRNSPGMRLIVSYADTVEGHNGGIYQASNWIYVGQTPPSFEYRLAGKRLQKRAFTGSNFGKGKMQLPTGAQKISVPGKHKYILPLDKDMTLQVQSHAKPYPTRPKQATGEDHSPSGGAAPTRTLLLPVKP